MLPKLRSRKMSSVQDRIFISYRRSDTEGYAGRLEDALKGYFGEHRVFRDVGGITPGEDFKHKIEESIERAGALIVLIGPNWLASQDGGKPRLHELGDQVAVEIKAALDRKRVIVPVLVEGASMPHEEDLPDALKELTRRNAVSIRDADWRDDTTRLAKVLAIDVSGSVAERRLDSLKFLVLSLLVVSMVFTFVMFAKADVREASIRVDGSATQLIPQLISAVNPIFIVVVALLLASTTTWIDPSRRKFVWAAVVLGCLGVVCTFIYYLLPFGDEYFAFIATSITITVMLGLLALSGFKPNNSMR